MSLLHLRPLLRASLLLVLGAGCIISDGSDRRDGPGRTLPTPSGNACDPASFVETCSTATDLEYCAGGRVAVEDCAAEGLICGYDSALGREVCGTASPSTDPRCYGLYSSGTCTGNLYEYCDDAGYYYGNDDCASYGWSCGCDTYGSCGCYDPGSPPPPPSSPDVPTCGPETTFDICSNNVRIYCVMGHGFSQDCGAYDTCVCNASECGCT